MLAETLTAELSKARTIFFGKLNSVCCDGFWDAAQSNTHALSTKSTVGMFACPHLEVMACSAVSDGR